MYDPQLQFVSLALKQKMMHDWASFRLTFWQGIQSVKKKGITFVFLPGIWFDPK